jgi:hypothetical protein
VKLAVRLMILIHNWSPIRFTYGGEGNPVVNSLANSPFRS